MSGAVAIILRPRGNKTIAKDGEKLDLKNTELIPFSKYKEKEHRELIVFRVLSKQQAVEATTGRVHCYLELTVTLADSPGSSDLQDTKYLP